ncbi:hypothetical protein [Cerasicoccus arenae]|uniref:Uncharacterized protein n=1 Tax=Cerasicoccus arenae TaxID=424488 RepID=A0A8J3DFT3_9BACT|nr:hypothetical protein [Cerasicoccus arenae]MBK1859039.1 hypothetical protein [Cerasicoccus arenae]GHB94892.1 hypothetical protein GCM10007047_08050 [Cerasicoccus arenae]
MRAIIINFTLLLLCMSLWAADDYRDFTDKAGRVMQAKPVSVIGNQVRIQREDGQEFNVSTDIFAKADQEFLDEWMLLHLAKNDRLFKIGAKEDGTRKEKTDREPMTYYNWEGFYKLSIENKSDLILDDIRVEYRFFVFDDTIAAQKRSEGQTDKTSGDLKIKLIGPRKTVVVETDKAKMQESKLDGGWVFTNSGDRASKDKLEGIHLKVFKGDLELLDYSEPTSLREKYKW